MCIVNLLSTMPVLISKQLAYLDMPLCWPFLSATGHCLTLRSSRTSFLRSTSQTDHQTLNISTFSSKVLTNLTSLSSASCLGYSNVPLTYPLPTKYSQTKMKPIKMKKKRRRLMKRRTRRRGIRLLLLFLMLKKKIYLTTLLLFLATSRAPGIPKNSTLAIILELRCWAKKP